MGKPCRLSFLAYRDHDPTATYGDGPFDHFTQANLINGIEYAEDLIEQGFIVEPLDEFSLKGFTRWAKETIRRGQNAWIDQQG